MKNPIRILLSFTLLYLLSFPPIVSAQSDDIDLIPEEFQIDGVGSLDFNSNIAFTGLVLTQTSILISDADNDRVLGVFQSGGDGTILELEIADVPVVFDTPTGLAYENEGEDPGLYIADYGNNRIIFTEFLDDDDDGIFEAEEFLTGLDGPTGLALWQGDLYIANRTGNEITVKPTDSSPAHPMTIVNLPGPAMSGPLGLAVTDTELYISDANNARVIVAPTDESSNASILTINLDLTNFTPSALFLSGEGDELVIADEGGDRLIVAMLDGSSAEALNLSPDLSPALENPSGLAADAGALFIADVDLDTEENRVVRVLFVDEDDGPLDVAILDIDDYDGPDIAGDGNNMVGLFAPDDEVVVIADEGNDQIIVVPQEGGVGEEVGLQLSGVDITLSDPRGMVTTDNGFFIADRENDRVLMAFVNDGDEPPFDVEVLAISLAPADELQAPYGLAADDNNLYISDGLDRIIRVPIGGGSSPLVGENAEILTIGGETLSDPRGLALDDTYLYIADSNNDRIVREPLDPNQSADVLQINDVGGLHTPVDVLTIDEELIIADQGNDRIVVVRFDEEDENEAFNLVTYIPGGLNGPGGLALGENHLFIADNNNNRIVRIAVENDGNDGDGEGGNTQENLIVTDMGLNAIFRVYEDGHREIISNNANNGGPPFIQLKDIAIEPSGHFVVTDPGYPAILRVNNHDGHRETVADESGAHGNTDIPLTDISRITVGNDGQIYALVGFENPGGPSFAAILRVDPNTGNRSILSGFDQFGFEVGDGGVSSFFGIPIDIEFNKLTGILQVTDTFGPSVYGIDPFDPDPSNPSGDRFLQTGGSQGTGSPIQQPTALAVTHNSVLIIDIDGDYGSGAVLLADLDDNGDRDVFSGGPPTDIGGGPAFMNPVDITIGENAGFVTDTGLQAIIRLQGGDPGQDPGVGDRSIFSQSGGPGDGPDFDQPYGIVTETIEIFSGIFLSLDEAFGDEGSMVRVPLKLDNPTGDPIGGLQASVRIDNPDLACVIAVEDTVSIPGFTVSVVITDSSAHFVVFSPSGATIPPNDPDNPICIGIIKYQMKEGSLNEETGLSVTDVVVGDPDGNELGRGVGNGRLQFKMIGDMNLDDNINVLDVIILVRRILDDEVDLPIFAIANANAPADEVVNVADVVEIVNDILDILLGTPGKAVPVGPVAVNLGEMVTLDDGQRAVPVLLDAESMMAGAQATFTFDPNLMEVGTPQFSGQTAGLAFDSRVEDGTLRVVVYSLMAEQGLGSGDTPMMLIPVTLLGNNAEITISDVVVADRYAQTAPVQIGTTTMLLGKETDLPATFTLTGNSPNPFNPSTSIAYEVPRQAHMTLVVYNILGQEVIRLVDEVQAAGRYTVQWNGTNGQGRGVASGVYMYRLTSNTGFTDAKRMILLK